VLHRQGKNLALSFGEREWSAVWTDQRYYKTVLFLRQRKKMGIPTGERGVPADSPQSRVET
jgi:hypothetical protein